MTEIDYKHLKSIR